MFANSNCFKNYSFRTAESDFFCQVYQLNYCYYYIMKNCLTRVRQFFMNYCYYYIMNNCLTRVRQFFSGLGVLLECNWGLQLAGGFGPSAFIGVCCFCISLSNAGIGVLWWYALVDVGVLVLHSLVYAGCTRGFVGGGWSLWTRTFFGVIGVTALGWALALQCRHGTS